MSDQTPNPQGGGSGPDDPSETKTVTIKDVLDSLADNLIKTMKVDELKAICKKVTLPQKGNKKKLLEAIFMAKYGLTDTYIRLMTVCKVCHAGVKVISTKKQDIGDGRVLFTRQIKCKGKRRHTYLLKNIVGVAKPEK